MGLLQAAYRTYEAQSHLAGVLQEGKEPLAPVAHMVQKAQIEVTITSDGRFEGVRTIPKEDNKTIIPATMKSSGRVGDNTDAHPLCDQLRYLLPGDEGKYAAYFGQLGQWANSTHTHPKVNAVYKYIQGGTMLQDLLREGVIALNPDGTLGDGNIEGTPYEKCLVRWRVIPAEDGTTTACWQDTSLFSSFTAFYMEQCGSAEQDVCMITGRQDIVCELHPKGVVPANYSAKLISANDNSGFTYRGRFATAHQAVSVSYIASQKAHNALRWIAANDGVLIGKKDKRTFLCWNPDGNAVPQLAFLGFSGNGPKQYVSYKKELLETLGGYRQKLVDTDVVIAALDAATTGRLSATYFNQLSGSDFLDRIERWYTTCCWDMRSHGVRSPSLRCIVSCAFGAEQEEYIVADDGVLREHVQLLLHCMLDRQPVPNDLVQALVIRAGNPLAYNPINRETLLTTACALVRKHRNDRANKEEWTLSLDTANTNRSYLFGRLLAVAEQVERATYGRDEAREPNAIRMQTIFSQRPLYAWRIIAEQLNPYFAHLTPGLRVYYKNIIGEILEKLSFDDPGVKLDDVYLLGYYHQRSALFTKKEEIEMEENENERS